MGIKKYIQFISEAAIPPSDFRQMMNALSRACAYRPLSIEMTNNVTEPHGVIFKNYDDFYNALPDSLKHTAPPRGTPLFGFFDADNRINIVASIPMIGIRELPFIHHMVQHESVHVGQWERRAGKVEWTLPDPKDRKAYFSNKDEIMAFAQSITEMMITQQGVRSMDDVQGALITNRLWNDIKKYVDSDVKSRYLKYIYEYIKSYIDDLNNPDRQF